MESIKETSRAERRFAWMEDLVRDVAYGVRMLRREPRFAVVVILTLGVGIGACTAIFSVVSNVLLRPLPYPESGSLVVLMQTNPPRFPELVVLPKQYVEWQRQITTFDGLAAVRTRSYNLTDTSLDRDAGQPLRVSAARLTANTLGLLRVRPALGRDFLPEEDVPGKGNVVLLGHDFWRRQFGGRADVLEATVKLDGVPFTIVGVLPKGFELEGPLDLYLPAAYTEDDRQNRRSLGAHTIEVLGRLKPGVTLAGARSEMTLIADRLAAAHASPGGGRWGVKVTPMLESRVGDTRPVLFALLGAVVFLLVIACANVANLLLGRATVRAREIAVRAALGATPGRIVRQLFTESVLLATGGALLGLLGAHVGTGALAAFAPDSLPRAAEIALDARALAVACGVTLLSAIGFGLAPAWAAAGKSLHDTLKEGDRGSGEGGAGSGVRGALVVAEMAIAIVLLAGAGLVTRSFARLSDVDRGLRPEGAVTFSASLAQNRYPGDPALAAFAERAVDRLAAVPGVTAVGASQALPFSVDLNIVYFQIAGHPVIAEAPITHVFEVTTGYFKAMGIRLLRGRLFDRRDRAGTQRVAIINQALARRFFPDEDPIGKRIGRPDTPPAAWSEIVGVVADVKDGMVYKLEGAPTMQSYVPFAQNPYDVLSFVVRVERDGPGGDPDADADRVRAPTSGLTAAIRRAIADVDRNQAITTIRPLGDLVARSVARQRFAMFLFGVFSVAALGLAAIGVYGVMAYSVARRTGEIGIRMALGAGARDVMRLVLVEGARLIALGVGAGLVGALLLTRFLVSLLFGVSPYDPFTFAGIAALLTFVAGAACALPARRATKVHPMTALRAE
jgi:putative ABC transport system permease protein